MARHPPAQRCEGITYTAAEVVFDRLQLCLHACRAPPPPATVGGGDGGRRRILEMAEEMARTDIANGGG